jgi:hypothetical protein
MGVSHQPEHIRQIFPLYMANTVLVSPDLFFHFFSFPMETSTGLKVVDAEPENCEEIL